MSDFLAAMAASSLLRADGVRTSLGASELDRRAHSAGPVRQLTLSDAGFDVIAETKLASPSEGPIADPAGTRLLEATAEEFAVSGAAAISVLTEPEAFGGELAHLTAVAGAVDLPVMRKDFLVDPIQVLEARGAGASGVLLIARILDAGLLEEMTDLTLELGMFALVELFEADDLEIASGVFDRQVLVGVNCRDLGTLRVDRGRHAELVAHLPEHLPRVAESGLLTTDDVVRVADLGYQLALVGSSLMKSDHPGRSAGELISAGRSRLAVGS
jgi:indole-3-glycerol phosphate synthase